MTVSETKELNSGWIAMWCFHLYHPHIKNTFVIFFFSLLWRALSWQQLYSFMQIKKWLMEILVKKLLLLYSWCDGFIFNHLLKATKAGKLLDMFIKSVKCNQPKLSFICGLKFIHLKPDDAKCYKSLSFSCFHFNCF